MIYQHQFIGHQKNQKIADPNHPVAKDPFDSSECPRNRIHTQKYCNRAVQNHEKFSFPKRKDFTQMHAKSHNQAKNSSPDFQ